MYKYCKYCDPILPASHFIKENKDSAVISDWMVKYNFCEEEYILQNSILFRPKEKIKYYIENKALINYCPWCGRKLNSHEVDFSILNR